MCLSSALITVGAIRHLMVGALNSCCSSCVLPVSRARAGEERISFFLMRAGASRGTKTCFLKPFSVNMFFIALSNSAGAYFYSGEIPYPWSVRVPNHCHYRITHGSEHVAEKCYLLSSSVTVKHVPSQCLQSSGKFQVSSFLEK